MLWPVQLKADDKDECRRSFEPRPILWVKTDDHTKEDDTILVDVWTKSKPSLLKWTIIFQLIYTNESKWFSPLFLIVNDHLCLEVNDLGPKPTKIPIKIRFWERTGIAINRFGNSLSLKYNGFFVENDLIGNPSEHQVLVHLSLLSCDVLTVGRWSNSTLYQNNQWEAQ